MSMMAMSPTSMERGVSSRRRTTTMAAAVTMISTVTFLVLSLQLVANIVHTNSSTMVGSSIIVMASSSSPSNAHPVMRRSQRYPDIHYRATAEAAATTTTSSMLGGTETSPSSQRGGKFLFFPSKTLAILDRWPYPSSSILHIPRGGSDAAAGDNDDDDDTMSSATTTTTTTTKKKKGGKSKTSKSKSSTKNEKKNKKTEKKTSQTAYVDTKKAIDKAMQDKDAAQAMGDAIRERADIVRQTTPYVDRYNGDPFLQAIDRSVASVGRAMGASDVTMARETLLFDDDGGGVRAPPSAIIANYFLKSHGGAHLFQSICSTMAVTACFAVFVAMSKSSPKWTLIFFRRALVFAMIKHMAGLLSSAVIAAKAVSRVGLSKSRQWMEQVARDPVSHYIFYAAILLVWLPSKSLVTQAAKAATQGAAATASAAAAGSSTVWWWPKHARWLIPIVLGPILLREVISTLLVISDVMILWTASDQNVTFDWILSSSQSVINAVMSLLVSPTTWRTADPSERQAILASLVSKVSLAFEGAVGAVLLFDLLIGFVQLAFGVSGAEQRPSFWTMFLRLGIVRLYVHYMLYIRRSKYSKLASVVRGGASHVPFWVIDTLMDPTKAMGINLDSGSRKHLAEDDDDDDATEMSMLELISVGFGLEDSDSVKK